AAVAETQGPGARQSKERVVRQLLARASQAEREILGRIVGGEMRTGVSDGLVLEAIAQVAGTPVGSVRRAALRLGDLSAVAVLAATGGAAALAAAPARPGVPLQPMLAESADDVDEALAAHRGRSALEVKYDGALVREMPLALYFFDCLMADGRSLLDEPYERRWEALAGVTGGRYLGERVVVADAEAGRAFFARALEAGHEGMMAKDPESPYEPG